MLLANNLDLCSTEDKEEETNQKKKEQCNNMKRTLDFFIFYRIYIF